MGEGGLTGSAYVLPPRQPTFLVRFSRSSKLATVALSLVGIVALAYLFAHLFTKPDEIKEAGHHAPRISSADKQEKAARPRAGSGKQIAGADVDDTLNAQDDRTVPMAMAPDPGLTENTSQGDLPRIGEDGRQPWQVYARPFNVADHRPRLAIVVAGLGLSRTITDAAVSRLPAGVTLVFDVQGPAIAAWCGRARQNGHEILLSVPMEPFDYPRSDPGPHTLLANLSNTENLQKLNWGLRQASGYVGIATLSGSRFTTNPDKLKFVMQTLRERGLMILDAHAAPHGVVTSLAHEEHVPVATVNERIDDDLSPEAIDNALEQLEQAARLNGHAVGIVAPLPIVIDHLQTWLKTLPEHGIALAPVSAVVQ